MISCGERSILHTAVGMAAARVFLFVNCGAPSSPTEPLLICLIGDLNFSQICKNSRALYLVPYRTLVTGSHTVTMRTCATATSEVCYPERVARNCSRSRGFEGERVVGSGIKAPRRNNSAILIGRGLAGSSESERKSDPQTAFAREGERLWR